MIIKKTLSDVHHSLTSMTTVDEQFDALIRLFNGVFFDSVSSLLKSHGHLIELGDIYILSLLLAKREGWRDINEEDYGTGCCGCNFPTKIFTPKTHIIQIDDEYEDTMNPPDIKGEEVFIEYRSRGRKLYYAFHHKEEGIDFYFSSNSRLKSSFEEIMKGKIEKPTHYKAGSAFYEREEDLDELIKVI